MDSKITESLSLKYSKLRLSKSSSILFRNLLLITINYNNCKMYE